MSFSTWLRRATEEVRPCRRGDLPPILRLHWLAPLCLVLISGLGNALTLPPGPLCDQGMVLFFEGGCDWGLSNLFFFSKVGSLLTVNAMLLIQVLARPGRPASLRSYLPHLVLALVLVVLNRSEGSCAGYYPEPNGNLGQMILELTAFGLLGLALGRHPRLSRPWAVAPVLVAWNGAHLGLFYLWLRVWPHWSWAHSFALAGSLLGIALILEGDRATGRNTDS